MKNPSKKVLNEHINLFDPFQESSKIDYPKLESVESRESIKSKPEPKDKETLDKELVDDRPCMTIGDMDEKEEVKEGNFSFLENKDPASPQK